VTRRTTVYDDETAQEHAKKTPPQRRRRATPGTLDDLARELWHATRTIGAVLDDPALTPLEACRVANSLAALANSYRGVYEAGTLETRLAELEQRLGAG
jgi:hypothetical protein